MWPRRSGRPAGEGEFFAAVAEMADVAAGMCFDAGTHTQVERRFRLAVGCATESGDWPIRAKALSGLASLAVHQGNKDDALSFSEIALVRADRLTPLVRSVMQTRHARALGLAGGQRQADFLTAVRHAEDFFSTASGENEPAWITYYGAAHLDRDIGRALLHLAVTGGDYQQAQQRLSAAVARLPEQPSRGKALALANLAHLTMARDDPAHAVHLGSSGRGAVGPGTVPGTLVSPQAGLAPAGCPELVARLHPFTPLLGCGDARTAGRTLVV